MNSKIFAIANQKGGSCKTTTAVNVVAALTKMGVKTLLVDIDPQSHATLHYGISKKETRGCSIRDIIVPPNITNNERLLSWDEVLITTDEVDIIPCEEALAGANKQLPSELGYDRFLEEALYDAREHYGAIVIDCPPEVGVLTVMAFIASDRIIIPVEISAFALEGLTRLQKSAETIVKRKMNPDLRLSGILCARVDERRITDREIIKKLRQKYKDLLFDTRIPENVSVKEAQDTGGSIFVYSPESKGARAYWNFAEELIKREDLPVKVKNRR